jgi:predicted nucleic-acid-binding protein
MVAADSNVLVRLLAEDDAAQAAAAGSFIASGAWVSLVALTETIWVLRSAYERQPDQLAGAIELLLNHETLTLQDPDVVAGALELYRARPSLGFSDCIIMELARKAGQLPLGTFDRKLARVEGTRRL